MKTSLFLLMSVLLLAMGGGVPAAEAPVDSTLHGPDFDLDCARCHTPENWRTLREVLDFDHDGTGFDLHGTHADTNCADCHLDPIFANIGVSCADCHRDLTHRGELGFDCARCHDSVDWRQSANLLLEHQQTRFPLMGRHALMDCEACHTDVQHDEFAGLATDCFGCHEGDYSGSSRPDHRVLGFGGDCQQCHSVAHLDWDQAAFSHPGNFPLRSGHGLDDCNLCHTESQPSPDGQDCYSCHEADYDGSHASNGFPTDCRHCHDPDGFDADDGYAHSASGFPGFGAHAETACFICHSSGVYSGLPRDCFICHSQEYNEVYGPNHPYPTTCESCHSPAGWDRMRSGWEGLR